MPGVRSIRTHNVLSGAISTQHIFISHVSPMCLISPLSLHTTTPYIRNCLPRSRSTWYTHRGVYYIPTHVGIVTHPFTVYYYARRIFKGATHISSLWHCSTQPSPRGAVWGRGRGRRNPPRFLNPPRSFGVGFFFPLWSPAPIYSAPTSPPEGLVFLWRQWLNYYFSRFDNFLLYCKSVPQKSTVGGPLFYENQLYNTVVPARTIITR